ncbi:MAG: MmgE/PrpD family protein [Verrucomicrobiota bacterium JB024]|nr:MmgE/PrpD family protein [Verrucomicrobiota bacterium JB024]
MSIARILAELAIETAPQAFTRSSRDAALKMLLDTCGCAYCGMDAPGIRELIALEYELAAPGNGSVFFSERKLSLPSAAYSNAAMMHALDFDNNYPKADIHIMAMVVPVGLACCEEAGASGRQFIDSVILGVEVAARIAKPYMSAKRQHSYFLTTSLVGGWGAVATAARLLGLTVDETVHAMGIYYAHTCGNRQALLEKSLTKRIQPAIAAKAALYSVLLARRGITGPEQVFEGKGGFYRCYTQDEPPPRETFTASAIHAIEELSVKHFPTCGIHHANIVSALHLKREYGFEHGDIKQVDFFLHEGGGTLVSMPFLPGAYPQIDTQFCAPYAIALALNKAEVSVGDFDTKKILEDTDTWELAQRTREQVRFVDMNLKRYAEPRPDCKYTKVTLHDGRVFEHEQASGVLNDPASMGVAEVRNKFRQCVTMHGDVDPAQVERIADTILDVEQADRMGEWIVHIFSKKPHAQMPSYCLADSSSAG